MSTRHLAFSCMLALSFMLACADKKEGPPPEVLKKDKMIEVMTDMEIAEAILKTRSNERPADTVQAAEFYQGVFHKHGISREEYRKSYQYYARRPSDMEVMYKEVINLLSEKHAEMQGEKKSSSSEIKK